MNKPLGLAVVMLTLAMAPPEVPGALASDMIEVNLGYSHVIGPVGEMATVVVGNHGVADATLGGGGTIILTGKALGVTNLIVLDERGRELLASSLHVVPLDRRPTTTVRIISGVAKARDYLCGDEAGCTPVGGTDAASSAAAMVMNDTDEASGAQPDEGEASDTVPDRPETDAPAVREQVSLNP